MTVQTEKGSESVRCNICEGPLSITQPEQDGVFVTAPCPTCNPSEVAAAKPTPTPTPAPAVVQTEKGTS